MTTYWIQLRDWYLTRFRGAGRRGKLALLAVPLLLACCGVSFLSTLISPPDAATPTAEVAARAATVELAEAEPTDEPAAPTDEPTTAPSPTTRPTNTARPTTAPTATDEPTEVPARAATMGAATALFATAEAQPTAAPPTVAPATSTSAPAPTAAPTLTPTAVPPTALPPTEPPQPTAPPVASSSDVAIQTVNYNGDINPQEPDEFAVIVNRGASPINLGGWRLNAGEDDQNFYFPAFDLQPGQSCRVYTNQVNADSCGGGTFGSGQAIWNNGGDCGALFDSTGAEVSRFCW